MTPDRYDSRGADDNGEVLCSITDPVRHDLPQKTQAHPQFMRLPPYELQEITD